MSDLRISFLLSFIFCFGCQHVSSTQPLRHIETQFDRIWLTAKSNIYPSEKEGLFSVEKYLELKSKLNADSTLADLAEVLNPFLESLNVSHTRLFVENDLDYYFFRSLFSTHEPTEPKVFHIGAQFKLENSRYIVRTVLQGYPAQKIGLRRGDIVIAIDEKRFHPINSFVSGAKNFQITFERSGKLITTTVTPVFESTLQSFLQATINSAKIYYLDGKKIGYVQLWTGAFNSSAILSKIIHQKMKNVDGLILDLRDGFGAAWWDHLDSFFPDTSNYFVAEVTNRNGSITIGKPPKHSNPKWFTKPIVVLINEGVRSGKEALAYQFKKSKRAKLIGTTTAGAFVSGRGFFADEDNGYILYLAINGITLDGNQIEGVGISPDRKVNYPYDPTASDPQLTEAIKELGS